MQATIRIQGYDGVEQLALGKRTAVFAAKSRKHKVPVVIKVMLPHLAGDRRFLARFRRDIGVAAEICHENVVRILDYGSLETAHYVVVERYQGNPLIEILAEHPRVPTPVALAIVMQVGRALEAAHARGLIHRDVRPANIVITDDGAVKLSNFCFATDIGEHGRVTHAGKVTGTPAYMSPEQTRGEDLTVQSDMFSLGAVAFELLTGARAFGKGDFGAIVDRIQSGNTSSLSAANPLLAGAIVRLVERMLSADPAQRYGHISEALMDLEEAIDKYGYSVDAGGMTAYQLDPAGYTDHFVQTMLVQITGKAPPLQSASNATLLRYYEKVAFLDPNDEGARAELMRLRSVRASTGKRSPKASDAGAATGWNEDSAAFRFADLDPNAEYSVILESINPDIANEASFALKLSMKLRTPIPRIKSLVKSMPSRVSDRMAYKQATRLAHAIEELGGRARLDVCPVARPDRAPPKVNTRTPADATTCPSCGHNEKADADFCSICLHRFVKAKLDAKELLERAAVSVNPLDEAPKQTSLVTSFVGSIRLWPTPVKIVAGVAAVILLLQLLVR